MNSFDLTVPIPSNCTRLHILGNIALPSGYPSSGKLGDVLGSYILHTTSGKQVEIPLRWGYEVAAANLIHEGTRIQPLATEAQPALLYRKDFAREQYQILLYSTSKAPSGVFARLTCKVLDHDQALAVFAITGEQISI